MHGAHADSGRYGAGSFSIIVAHFEIQAVLLTQK